MTPEADGDTEDTGPVEVDPCAAGHAMRCLTCGATPPPTSRGVRAAGTAVGLVIAALTLLAVAILAGVLWRAVEAVWGIG